MKKTKKTYNTPELTIHGDVEEITLAANVTNADVPRGANGTAYPPGS